MIHSSDVKMVDFVSYLLNFLKQNCQQESMMMGQKILDLEFGVSGFVEYSFLGVAAGKMMYQIQIHQKYASSNDDAVEDWNDEFALFAEMFDVVDCKH